MKKYIFIVFFCFLAGGLLSQEVEWAYKVLKFSSQLDKSICSAKQILGKPNVLPIGGESPYAWAPAINAVGEESEKESSITVAFKNSIRVRQLAVAESYNPGSVKEITLISSRNKHFKVYENSPTDTTILPRMFNLFIPLTDYEVMAMKLTIAPGAVKGINQIDAVGISSSEDTIKALINCIDEAELFAEPENLGSNINSMLNETQPVISSDGKTLFFIRENSPDKFGVTNNSIMFSTLKNDNTWNFARILGGVLSNKGENGYSVMHDGTSLLLGNIYNKDGSVSSGLSVSHKEESGWSFPEKIQIKKFSAGSSNTTFFMSNDGKTLLLAFEGKGGFGGLDIYASFRLNDGSYSEPLNLGPDINSPADDFSPFLADDNSTLYFSSSGISGFGSSDIFMSRRTSEKWDKWTEPLNLGPKINSSDWDAYFTVPSSGDYGYYVSSKNSYGEGDIFRIELPRKMRPVPVIAIYGRIIDSATVQPLKSKIVSIRLPEKTTVQDFSTTLSGEYRLLLPHGAAYSFSVSAQDYRTYNFEIDLTNASEGYEISKDISLVILKPEEKIIAETLTKEKIPEIKESSKDSPAKKDKKRKTSDNLNELFNYKPPQTDKNILCSIFFDYSKSELKQYTFNILDSVAAIILSMPESVIEIAGNADPKGSFSFNTKLSIERAKKIKDYLISKNCDPRRLLVKGYSNLRSAKSEDLRVERRVDVILLQKRRFESMDLK